MAAARCSKCFHLSEAGPVILLPIFVNHLAHFYVTAEHVCKLHLAWRAALRREKRWAADDDTGAASAGSRDVKAVQVVEKLHAPGGIFGRRRGHRVDDDGCLLPLKLVHRAHLCARQALHDPIDLVIVRRDDQYFVERQSVLPTVGVDPGCSWLREMFHNRRHAFDFFFRMALVPLMRDRYKPETGSDERGRHLDSLAFKPMMRCQAAFIKQLGSEPTNCRVETPGFREKEALLITNRPAAA